MKQKIFFSKMHGLGNDFIIINNLFGNVILSTQMIKKMSNRNLGIGCDQLLLLEKSKNKKADFFYRIFNSNGIEVSQCGNGARCLAYYIILKNIIKKKKIYIQTHSTLMCIKIFNSNCIQVNMGKPNFQPYNIPFLYKKKKNIYNIKILNKKILCGVVSMGNPHCIIPVKNFNYVNVNKLGKLISSNNLFPESVNVGFMQIINKKKIFLRVYERHVGETNACGSAACAAVAVGCINDMLSNSVEVNLLGGSLNIKWKGLKYDLYMKGPAVHVYDGLINI
ncbi:diaminopimelate epimerase [Buchnera aphidicola (Mollitrichosiphum nigrofasciatum)]|uniref:diaminopimelate epimerase n=1 Tax=Buchnera aphidicola TaxID=9 RepID=UPI0031B8A6BB